MNNREQLQNQINNSHGTPIVISGEWNIDSSNDPISAIILPSNCHLIFQNATVTLKIKSCGPREQTINHGFFAGFYAENKRNITIEGTLTVYMDSPGLRSNFNAINTAAFHFYQCHDCNISGNEVARELFKPDGLANTPLANTIQITRNDSQKKSGYHGIVFQKSFNCSVEWCEVVHTRSYGFYFRNNTDCFIANNNACHTETDGFKFTGEYQKINSASEQSSAIRSGTENIRCTVLRNFSANNGRDGFNFYGGFINCLARDNAAQENQGHGFNVKGFNTSETNYRTGYIYKYVKPHIRESTFTGNVAESNTLSGFSFLKIEGCEIYNNSGISNRKYGFQISYSSNLIITKSKAVSNTESGFYLSSNSGIPNKKLTFVNCESDNNGQNDYLNCSGFLSDKFSHDNTFLYCLADNGSGRQIYGLYLKDGSKDNIVTHFDGIVENRGEGNRIT